MLARQVLCSSSRNTVLCVNTVRTNIASAAIIFNEVKCNAFDVLFFFFFFNYSYCSSFAPVTTDCKWQQYATMDDFLKMNVASMKALAPKGLITSTVTVFVSKRVSPLRLSRCAQQVRSHRHLSPIISNAVAWFSRYIAWALYGSSNSFSAVGI